MRKMGRPYAIVLKHGEVLEEVEDLQIPVYTARLQLRESLRAALSGFL